MAQIQHTPAPPYLGEAITGLFCQVDGAYAPLDSRGDCYGALKKLLDSALGLGGLGPLSTNAGRENLATLI
jgi:hypothetical protein